MTGPTVLHAAAEAVEHPLLAPHQVQVEAGPGGGVAVDLPQPETDRRGRPGEFLYGQTLVVSAQVDAAPGKSAAGPGELPSLWLTLSARHEGVDHHLVTRHHPTVVASSLREVGPHPLTQLNWSGLVWSLCSVHLLISQL